MREPGSSAKLRVAQDVVLARDVAAEQRAHPRRQLVQRKRLDQVVVGAGVEAGHAVGNRIARRHDQHADAISGAADFAQQLEAGLFRQAQVEQHQRVGAVGGVQRHLGREAVLDPVDRVALLLQRSLERLADHRVVFDQEDAHGASGVNVASPPILPAGPLTGP